MIAGYRFKAFDAARAMASVNPNEVSWWLYVVHHRS